MILTTSGLGPHEVTAAPVGDDLLSFTLNVSRILLVITICPLSTRATIGRYGGTQLFTTSQTAGAQCVELRLKPQLEAAR